ncbi:Destabilizer of plasmid inheritance [Serratia fonticola]|uniref:Destabilizer of plasmid inheritance n=1 Tax=Serratia fonticola TaxID=47917 RepID=A0A4U9TT28_SERFO|nr:Destabilizer of plasmid inheritance [Serratia fonticola]
MEWLNILIVEDETPLGRNACGIHQAEWRMPADLAGGHPGTGTHDDPSRFKPDLILLDNFLPDGQGIELLRELTLQGYGGGIVFITAASDMDTVAEALPLWRVRLPDQTPGL